MMNSFSLANLTQSKHVTYTYNSKFELKHYKYYVANVKIISFFSKGKKNKEEKKPKIFIEVIIIPPC